MLRAALKLVSAFVVLSIATLMAGCGHNAFDQAAYSPSPPSSSAAYTLRPSDQLRIQVYNEPTITGDYTIDGNGFLSVPLAGRIKVTGLTAEQLERTVTTKLNRGILKDARVNVQVSNYAPFYIRGEVKKPGEFPYRPRLTVGDAVALAGGYTYRADESKVLVRPADGSGEVTRSLNVDQPVLPGDNIQIPERLF